MQSLREQEDILMNAIVSSGIYWLPLPFNILRCVCCSRPSSHTRRHFSQPLKIKRQTFQSRRIKCTLRK
jgi:hypothetical protein